MTAIPRPPVLVVGSEPAVLDAAAALTRAGIGARVAVTGADLDRHRPASVSVITPDAGEHVPVAGLSRMRVLEDGISSKHRLGVAELTVPPHARPAPQHRHATHDEGFYVVSGSLRFLTGERAIDAAAGSFILVPPGVPHGFANVTGEPAVMLDTFTPGFYLNFFRDIAALRQHGEEVTAATAAEVMSRYATLPGTGTDPV